MKYSFKEWCGILAAGLFAAIALGIFVFMAFLYEWMSKQ